MSEYTQELRFKVDEETHRKFDVFTRSRSEDYASRLRKLVEYFIDSEEHAHRLRCRLLNDNGIGAESGRKPGA